MNDAIVSVEEEIAKSWVGKPHVVLLGAGASKAALPNGDKNGKALPLLRDLAETLHLSTLFPPNLRALARTDFEAAYSKLHSRRGKSLPEIERRVGNYFNALQLPEQATLYDFLLLSLKRKDAVFTFNWDPFLAQASIRLSRLGVRELPRLYFLHGNVAAGFCAKDGLSGISGRPCSKCEVPLAPSPLLFPVSKKNYQDKGMIQREWKAARYYLKNCFMFTIFGYSAPKTDVEAIKLLKRGWGSVEKRQYEHTEIINKPGCDEEALRATWDKFIHSHHYSVFGSFFDSWLCKHPRRSGEAYVSQYLDGKFIEDHPVPRRIRKLSNLVKWFEPLLGVERKNNPG